MTKRKIYIIAGAIIGFLILILIILWLISLFNHKYYTYEEVEAKMYEATDIFYKKNPQILPVNDGKSTLSYNTLVENNCIKPLNELLKDGDSCDAYVEVIKEGTNYSYIPKLTCSDKYNTIELTSHILKNHDLVTEGSGLYSDGQGGYYFKGKITDNYVTLGTFKTVGSKTVTNTLWQIISIDKDNRIKIRSLHSAGETMYDTRYNEFKQQNIGYNDFEMSLLKDKLKEIENNESFLTNAEKSKLTKSKLCLSTRSTLDKSKDGSTECSVLSNDEYLFGLMYPYEYMRASLDENCVTMLSRSCQNYNFLSGSGFYDSWILTPYKDNNYQIYAFDGISFSENSCNLQKALYVTSYLSPYTMFKSGDGTRENPFKLF